jgi:hypothetical protein
MTNSQRLATIRARFLRWLADQGVADPGPEDSLHGILRESILIRDEIYCGRRFHTASHQAVWFIEEDVLKIYQKTGELACVFTGDQINLAAVDDRTERETEETPDVIKLPAPVDRDDLSDDQIRRAA